MREQAVESLRRLNEIIERLRAPGGCPWDREQTHRTLRPYLLEETHEVLDAIDDEDEARLRDELGDVLLQVLMHAAIAQEREDGFDIGDVADTTSAKMVHRHPHVFGDARVEGAPDVVVNWERLKRSEHRSRLSVLDGVPRSLPALAFAQGVQKRPARLGFDETPTVQRARSRVATALSRVDEISRSAPAQARRGEDWTAGDKDSLALERSFGELLFAVVGLARQLRVNPEESLRAASGAFAQRFRALEAQARAEGVDLHDLDAAEWQRRWRGAAAGR
jgi:tetrapyrrole methylase family protein / MazG family protein